MPDLKINCLICEKEMAIRRDKKGDIWYYHCETPSCDYLDNIIAPEIAGKIAAMQQRLAELKSLETAAILFAANRGGDDYSASLAYAALTDECNKLAKVKQRGIACIVCGSILDGNAPYCAMCRARYKELVEQKEGAK